MSETLTKEEKSSQDAKRISAFTLIELVVVVAIISLLVFASIPTFREFINTSRLRQASYDVISALRTARASAVSNRIEYMTLFYTSMQNRNNIPNFAYAYPIWSAVLVYQVEEGPIGGWKRLPENIFLDFNYFYGLETGGVVGADPDGLPYPNNDEVVQGDSMPIVRFNKKGGVEGSGFPCIQLRDNSTQDTAAIRVLRSTGRIYLYSFRGKLVQE